MRLFVATVILWATTAVLEGRELPSPLLTWGWWTAAQYLCAASAWEDAWLTARDRVAGIAAFTLFSAYCIVMQETYVGFVPASELYPDLWPTVYMTMNLALPIGLVISGICRVAVQNTKGTG